MALFYAVIRRDSVSFVGFPFHSHVQVFLYEILLVCHLKCPCSCFSSHFFFLVIFVLIMLVLSVLFLMAIISLPLHFFMWSSRHCINASMHSWMLTSPLTSFLGTYSLSMSSLGCKALCIVMSFLVFWFICWSSSLAHFKNGPVYITRGTTHVFIPLIRFFYVLWFWVIFSFSSFFIFYFIFACLKVSTSNILMYM